MSLLKVGVAMDVGSLTERPDVNRVSFPLFFGPSSFGLRLFLGFGVIFLFLSPFTRFVGLFRQVMWGFMAFDLIFLRGVIVMWVFGIVGAAGAVLLLLITVKAIPGRNVFETKDMFGAFRWEVLIRNEQALGVWSPLITGEVGDQLGIPLYATLGLLFGQEIVAWLSFTGVKSTYNARNDIEVHCIASHSEELTFSFGPFPQLWLHALGS